MLHTILDNARFAPSGGNRQGAQVIVVRDLDDPTGAGGAEPPGARRYTAQKAAGEGPWNAAAPTSLSAEEIAATEVPDFWTPRCSRPPWCWSSASTCGLVAATDQELDRVGIVGGASVYPLVWNILLAARNEGFGGTITTMAVAAEPQVRELFGIPDDYAVAGRPAARQAGRQLTKLSRVSVDDLTRLEHWEGGPLS